MITIDSKLKKEIKDCEGDTTRLTAFLMKNYNVFDIAESLANSLLKDNAETAPKITISIEDFMNHIKVRGIREDGTIENRGQYSEEASKYIKTLMNVAKALKKE